MRSADSFDITIIGAGVVGLACAEELAVHFRNVLLVEKNGSFGQEISSRNSEVIHAGIYYPPGLLKSTLCVTGRRLLYEICSSRQIPHRKLGKLIVATADDELGQLEHLSMQAQHNGVDDLTLLGKRQIRNLEPSVQGEAALFSPSTGIIDTHQLMRSFLLRAEDHGALIAFNSPVEAIRQDSKGYIVEIGGERYRFHTKIIINCAGLQSDRIAAMAGIDVDRQGYRLKYCKGDYFTATPPPSIRHLVYPVPAPHNEGLGIHATIDLAGRVRFGPDSEYVEELHYGVSERKAPLFSAAVQRYLPGVSPGAMRPDMSGIRPKLQGPGEPYRDFVIRDEADLGYPGFINLIGIESPGLTSSPAIAKHVAALAGAAL